MSKPQITIGFIKNRKTRRIQEFKDSLQVGMLADDVVALARKKFQKMTKAPVKVAEVETGYTVEWYFQVVTLTLEREEDPGPYKVKEILIEEQE